MAQVLQEVKIQYIEIKYKYIEIQFNTERTIHRAEITKWTWETYETR